MRILELKASTRVKGRFLVKLDEGTLLRVGEQEILDFALYEGKEISIEEAETLEKKGQLSTLKNKAYGLLSRKPVSRHDLHQKLLFWEATPEEAEEICERFQELDLINDENYAQLLLRHYQSKGYGKKRIQQEFYQHGIPRELWEEVLSSLNPEDNQESIQKFIYQKLKGEKADKKELKRVSDALLRRGFSWDEVREGLSQYQEEYFALWEDC